jgi:hypothetical protein
MIELVRKPTPEELPLLIPFVENSLKKAVAAEQAQAESAEAMRLLAALAERLEPGADFDPNIMAFTRTHAEGK